MTSNLVAAAVGALLGVVAGVLVFARPRTAGGDLPGWLA